MAYSELHYRIEELKQQVMDSEILKPDIKKEVDDILVYHYLQIDDMNSSITVNDYMFVDYSEEAPFVIDHISTVVCDKLMVDGKKYFKERKTTIYPLTMGKIHERSYRGALDLMKGDHCLINTGIFHKRTAQMVTGTWDRFFRSEGSSSYFAASEKEVLSEKKYAYEKLGAEFNEYADRLRTISDDYIFSINNKHALIALELAFDDKDLSKEHMKRFSMLAELLDFKDKLL